MKIQNLNSVKEPDNSPSDSPAASCKTDPEGSIDRKSVEIALLRARIQHLELVIETARSLLGSNQDRLLRRLYEVPRELAALSSQLQRIDPQATW